MNKKNLDEFDIKAKELLKSGEKQRVRDILREYAMCVSYEEGEELNNPSELIENTGLQTDNISDFTEYRVAKSMIKQKIINGE